MIRLRAELGSGEEMTANKSKFDLCSSALAEWGTDYWILHHTLQHLIHRINSIKSYNPIHKERTNHLKEMILVKHPALSLSFIKAEYAEFFFYYDNKTGPFLRLRYNSKTPPQSSCNSVKMEPTVSLQYREDLSINYKASALFNKVNETFHRFDLLTTIDLLSLHFRFG